MERIPDDIFDQVKGIDYSQYIKDNPESSEKSIHDKEEDIDEDALLKYSEEINDNTTETATEEYVSESLAPNSKFNFFFN